MGQWVCIAKGDNDTPLYTKNSPDDEAIIRHRINVEKRKFKFLYKNPPLLGGELNDFCRIRTLGVGFYGRVILAQHIASKKFYAMKIYNKSKVVENKLVRHILDGKRIAASLNFQFIVSLVYSFKDNSNLYMAMDYIGGGELSSRINKTGAFPENIAKFYASQIVLCFRFLHSLDIAHRDLKTENLLIAEDGYIKLTDFGYAKIIKDRTWTLCGTPEYLAPEIILGKGYNKSVDWWSFGVLVYEMIAGFPPFYDNQHMRLYEKIIAGHVRFLPSFSQPLKHLLMQLIETDLTKRYGNLKDGIYDITTHRWFSDINWLNIYQKAVKAPHIPLHNEPGGTCKYYNTFDEEPLIIAETVEYEEEFAGF